MKEEDHPHYQLIPLDHIHRFEAEKEKHASVMLYFIKKGLLLELDEPEIECKILYYDVNEKLIHSGIVKKIESQLIVKTFNEFRSPSGLELCFEERPYMAIGCITGEVSSVKFFKECKDYKERLRSTYINYFMN